MALPLLLLHTAIAQAQTLGDGLDTERFKPSMDSQGLILTEAGQGELFGDLNLGIYFHYSRHPLVIEDGGGDLLHALVEDRISADVYFSIAVTDWLTLALDVPVFLYQSGKRLDADNASRGLTSSGFGDIRVAPKFTLLRQSRFGISLALSVPVTLPSGYESAYQGSDSVTAMPTLAASRSFLSDSLLVAANLGFWLKGDAEMKNLSAGHEMFYKAGAKFRFLQDWAVSAELAGGARIESMGSNLPNETPMELLAAAHYAAPADLQLTLGGGVGALPGWGTPTARAFVGLRWSPRKHDQDGDGVEDEQDRCRTEKGPADNDGCPWGDTDGDGLTDDRDECPRVAGPRENRGCRWGDADSDGVTDNLDACPERAGPEENKGCPWGDADGDGVTDNLDACPEQAGPEDNKGCPWGDADGDGLDDKRDECPEEAEDEDGFQDEDGCPDRDNDKDGIADGDDACPEQAEVINGYKDGDGCPDEGKVVVVVKKDKIEIMKKVYFATGKAVIRNQSYSLLDQVAQNIRAHDEIEKVRVEGHTDASGPEDFNMKLSQRRAEAVRDYLIDKGIAAERLEAVGYGESQPIASNKTRRGRSKNRRVEFVIAD
jgi:outer membrane protein OmpA-like peptidoglycan-associated protein